jgi:hypothetical protein
LRLTEDVLLLDRHVPLSHPIVNLELGPGIILLEEQLLTPRRSSDPDEPEGEREDLDRDETDPNDAGWRRLRHEAPPFMASITGTANSVR